MCGCCPRRRRPSPYSTSRRRWEVGLPGASISGSRSPLARRGSSPGSTCLSVRSGLVNQPQAGVLSIYEGEGIGGTLLATQGVTFQYFLTEFQTFQFSTSAFVQAGNLYTYRFSIPQITVGWGNLNCAVAPLSERPSQPRPGSRLSLPGSTFLRRPPDVP